MPDFDGLEPDELISLIEPHLSHLFPHELLFPSNAPSADAARAAKEAADPVFLTQRSASLWAGRSSR